MAMPDLSQFQTALRLERQGDRIAVWDPVRKKMVALNPEEWVRQLFIQYLIGEKGFSTGLIRVEQSLRLHGMLRRFDILAYNRAGQAWLMVECKSADIALSQAVVDQVARYNLALGVPYLAVTNGAQTRCCQIEAASQSWRWLDDIPACPAPNT